MSAPSSKTSVVELLAQVRQRRLIVRLVHAGLFSVGGAAAVLAACLDAGFELPDRSVVALVLSGALAAGAIYLGDTARGAENLARELDWRLGRAGGLLTAWQAERRDPDSRFSRLLAEREAHSLRGGEALSCCAPHWSLAVLLPLLLAAWCASTAAREEDPGSGVQVAPLYDLAFDALASAAQSGRDRPGPRSTSQSEVAERGARAMELQRLATRARRDAAQASRSQPEEVDRVELESLRRDVEQQLERGGLNESARRSLERALDALESLERGLGSDREASPRASQQSAAEDRPTDPGSEGGGPNSAGPSEPSESNSAEPVGGADPAAGGDPSRSTSSGAEGGQEQGVVPGQGQNAGAGSPGSADPRSSAESAPSTPETPLESSVQRRRPVPGPGEAALLEAWLRRSSDPETPR